jgi:hypothetical protein
MKLKRLTLILPFVLCLTTGTHADAQDDVPAVPIHRAPGWRPVPKTVQAWADRCTDFTINSWGFKDPKNFVKWVEMFSEPAIWLEFAKRAEHPKSWVRVANTLVDPRTAKNYLEWTDPEIYLKWAVSFMNPEFYYSLMLPFLDPTKYVRWATVPLDPRFQDLVVNAINPETLMSWLSAPIDPDNWTPLIKALDPENMLRWAQVLTDPSNYLGLDFATQPFQGMPAGNPSPVAPPPYQPSTWPLPSAAANPYLVDFRRETP